MSFQRIAFTRPPLAWRLANTNIAVAGTVSSTPLRWTELCRTDPAALIALAVRYESIGQVDGAPIPAEIRDGLRAHAQNGHTGACATLDWLDKSLLNQIAPVGDA